MNDWFKEVIRRARGHRNTQLHIERVHSHQFMHGYNMWYVHWARKNWQKYCDKNGLIQRDRFHQFILNNGGNVAFDSRYHNQDLWLRLFDAADRLDTRYKGITVKDFVDTYLYAEW